MKTNEEKCQELEEVLEKIRETLRKKAFPKKHEDKTIISLSENVLEISPNEVEPFIVTMTEALKRKRVLNSFGFFNQSRKVCADYFCNILPLIIDEYNGNMDVFIDRFCFSPDNHGDRTCLAKALQKKGILNDYFKPVSEKGWEILRSFYESTGRSPYEKDTPEMVIEDFMTEIEDLIAERRDVSDFLHPDEY